MKNLTLKFSYIDIIVCLFFICTFTFIWYFVNCDLQIHAYFLKASKKEGMDITLKGGSLYYFLLNLFSLGIPKLFGISTIIILSIATFVKYLLFKYKIFIKTQNTLISIYYALSLCLIMIIPTTIICKWHYYHYCAITPNVWHNSTVILLMPFAVLLFTYSLKILNETFNFKNYITIVFLIIANILIKPSFIFCFIPGYFILIFTNRNNFRNKLLLFSLLFIAILLLYILFYFLYPDNGDSSIKLQIWGLHYAKWGSKLSSHLFYSVGTYVIGLLFPIYVIYKYYYTVKKDLDLKFSIILYAIGLIISISLVETGPRYTHGNFMWQGIVCSAILNFSLALFLIENHFFPKNLTEIKSFEKVNTAFLLYNLQLIMGIIYLAIVLFTKKYMYF